MKHPVPDKVNQEIIARLTRLEKAVFKHGQKTGTEKSDKASGSKGLPAHILNLRDQNFFRKSKTAGDVRERLRSKYPCEYDRVAMALLRLQRRKQLRKSSKVVDKKMQVAYVW